MKKILNLLGTITLIGTSTTSLISCEKPNNNENEKGNKHESEPTSEPEKPQQPPKNSNWKLINNSKENLEKEFEVKNDKWYILIFANKFILKEKYDENNKIKLFDFNNTADGKTYKGIKFGTVKYVTLDNLVFYRWNGGLNEPETPEINSNTGKIIDWKG